ncbi:hypothetical protein SAMN05445850_5532 [Paraburkholderia tuberum]|uniref:Uncharacterized protein n=2 Tax=Paraburkholderia tuberum TaxID=157910 RepID=A0A1H1JS40_9BURK|nr:hypothetical protein SAMN05445850_5532 [Paraburkholderia tuberum]
MPRRIPAASIPVSDDALSSALIAMGGDSDPKRNPSWRVALAIANCRRTIDPAPWAQPAASPEAFNIRQPWRPPRSLRLVAVSGKDRAAGDTDPSPLAES